MIKFTNKTDFSQVDRDVVKDYLDIDSAYLVMLNGDVIDIDRSLQVRECVSTDYELFFFESA